MTIARAPNNLDIKVSIDEESHQRVGSPEEDLRTLLRPRNPWSVQIAVEVNYPLAFHVRLTVAFVDSKSVPSFFPSSGNRRPQCPCRELTDKSACGLS